MLDKEENFKKLYCREINDHEIDDFIKRHTFLITGGAGSIGSSLISMLVSHGAKKVLALDNDETRLERLKRRVKGKVELILADIRDMDSLSYNIEEVDVIYHTAALKHVPLSEFFPLEYVKTNIMGTENLIKLAIRLGSKKFIYVSTDKAVNPTNVMGATKLLGEKLVIASNLRKRDRDSHFSVVRFGNVLYTRGSVIEIFLNQVIKGNYITVTDPNMTRFIMNLEDAVRLILRSTIVARGGEVFVFKMPSVKINDLARAFLEVIRDIIPALKSKKIDIVVIGRRPGEKIHEELMTDEEAYRSIECQDMYVILSELVLGKAISFRKKKVYNSYTAPKLDLVAIKSILRKFISEMLSYMLQEHS